VIGRKEVPEQKIDKEGEKVAGEIWFGIHLSESAQY
jgi:hypothetical protein